MASCSGSATLMQLSGHARRECILDTSLPVFSAFSEQAGIPPSQVRFDSADIVLYYCFT
jgi:hypothetical protein